MNRFTVDFMHGIGCMEHWPALEKWKDVNYIMEKMGPRTVPVEVGSSYASTNWSQKLMTVRSFIENFMLSDENGIGYLAQHQLFNQVPTSNLLFGVFIN